MLENKRNTSIETLRGIAILLVVVGHVIGSGSSGGMKIDFPHSLRYIYLWIDFIQMPLFTAIAGWVYGVKPFSTFSNFRAFAKSKALRLLVPMITVGTLYFLVQQLVPGTNQKNDISQLWRIYVFPYTIYWYLPSLFLIFMMQWWIDKHKWMNSMRKCWICVVAGVLLTLTNDVGIMHSVPNIFSFKGALGQLPYFFVGVGVQRFVVYSRFGWKKILAVFILFISSLFLMQLVWEGTANEIELLRLCYPLLLIPILVLLLLFQWKNRFFIWIGGYSYSIYLFHGFGTAGGRILLKLLGVYTTSLIFMFATSIAALGSVVVDKLVSNFKIGRRFFLGKW